MNYTVMMLILIILSGIVFVTLRVMKRKKRGTTSNKVVSITDYSKKKPLQNATKCSYCKQPAKRLIFYAEHNGQVVGLCSTCQKIAKRKDMLPI